MIRLTRPAADYFWERVHRTDGCWLYTGPFGVNGYGLFSHGFKNRAMRAHRFSWELANGSIPGGMVVMHTCDNRACVNPSHLRLGTIAENNRDCVAKGRNTRGTMQGAAKLDEQKVREIRRSDLSLQQLARRYGVTKQAIWSVRHRLTWTFVGDQ